MVAGNSKQRKRKWPFVAESQMVIFLIMKDFETELERDAKEMFQTVFVNEQSKILEKARAILVTHV
jgi:hypothetical protein